MLIELQDLGLNGTGFFDTDQISAVQLDQSPKLEWRVLVHCGGMALPFFFEAERKSEAEALYSYLLKEIKKRNQE